MKDQSKRTAPQERGECFPRGIKGDTVLEHNKEEKKMSQEWYISESGRPYPA